MLFFECPALLLLAAPLGVGTDSDNDNANDNNCDKNDGDSDAANREYATRTETETPLKRGKRLRKPGGGSENQFFAPLFARQLRLCLSSPRIYL